MCVSPCLSTCTARILCYVPTESKGHLVPCFEGTARWSYCRFRAAGGTLGSAGPTVRKYQVCQVKSVVHFFVPGTNMCKWRMTLPFVLKICFVLPLSLRPVAGLSCRFAAPAGRQRASGRGASGTAGYGPAANLQIEMVNSRGISRLFLFTSVSVGSASLLHKCLSADWLKLDL